MDWMSLAIGLLAITFGMYTWRVRKNSPDKFSKLEPMKKFWGERRGNLIHVVGYTIVPIVFGVIFLRNLECY